jgi:hypothetical protein
VNQLTKYLIGELLEDRQVIGLFGGGFKPPTKGHFGVVEQALKEYPELDKLIVYVGGGIRDGITQEQSLVVWDRYKDLLGNKVDIQPSPSPIGDIIRYGRDNPDQIVYFFLGEREGKESDAADIASRTKNIEIYPNIKVKIIKSPADVPDTPKVPEVFDEPGTEVSGTTARDTLLNPKKTLEDFKQFLPDGLTDEEKQQIYDLLKKGAVKEGTCGYDTDVITGKKLDTPGGISEADPKTGTGKKPKGSGRRLYTDEDPSDTVKVKFSTKQDIIDTLSKESFKSKPHARQSQIINLIHQRVRAAYERAKDPEVKSRLKNALEYAKQRKEASKEKTERLRKLKENVAPNHSGKSSPYGSGYKPLLLEISKFMINQGMEIQPLPKVQFIEDDITNAQNILGTTAYYNPQSKTIVLYTLDRHPKDILRSFCHEIVHHEQNIKGTLGNIKTQNTTEDSHLDEIEREAYERGNIMFRNWADSLSKKTWQSENMSVRFSYGVKENSRKMREEKGDKGTGGYEIYCDMDGVLCDFDERFKEFSNGISPKEFEAQHGKKEFWKLINNQGVGFWVGIHWMPDGRQLWSYIKKHNPSLLSAPSMEESSRLGKRLWVRNNIPGTKLILRSAEQKQESANPNAILIDDRPSNIEQWRAKSGIGILHTSANETIKQLKKYDL